jgi:hypothetical protein
MKRASNAHILFFWKRHGRSAGGSNCIIPAKVPPVPPVPVRLLKRLLVSHCVKLCPHVWVSGALEVDLRRGPRLAAGQVVDLYTLK